MITHAVININNLKTTAIMVDRSHSLKNCRISISFPYFCFQVLPQHMGLSIWFGMSDISQVFEVDDIFT